MCDQNTHVKGMVIGVVVALWTAAFVGSGRASTVSLPSEQGEESSTVATSTEEGTSGIHDDTDHAVSAIEGSGGGMVEPMMTAPATDPAIAESATGLRVPSDGIRQRVHSVGEVVGQPAGRVLLAVNDVITLKFDRGEQPQPRQRYAIARRAQFVEHPESGRNMGYLIHVIGTVEVEQAFGRYWSGRIMSASDYVSIDDVVLPLGEPVAEVLPDASTDQAGRIVAVQDNLALTATSQVVYTDLGADQGVKPGDEFSVIREGVAKRNGFSDRFIGVLRVVATQPTSSSAYVTRSSEPIVIGDRLERRATEASPQ
ncbi:MAG: hypothetical protein ACOYXU_07755 [Nitrospirota bacterium]